MSDQLLDRDALLEPLDALAERLKERGVRASVYVIGGAAISLVFDARRATRDIDSVVLEDMDRSWRKCNGSVVSEACQDLGSMSRRRRTCPGPRRSQGGGVRSLEPRGDRGIARTSSCDETSSGPGNRRRRCSPVARRAWHPQRWPSVGRARSGLPRNRDERTSEIAGGGHPRFSAAVWLKQPGRRNGQLAVRLLPRFSHLGSHCDYLAPASR